MCFVARKVRNNQKNAILEIKLENLLENVMAKRSYFIIPALHRDLAEEKTTTFLVCDWLRHDDQGASTPVY